MLRKYLKTMTMTAQNTLNAGIIYSLPGYFIKIIHVVPLLVLWTVLFGQGARMEMTLSQMLTYTYISTLLGAYLFIKSPLTEWLYDGVVSGFYQHPMPLYGNVIAQTIGKNISETVILAVPMLLAVPLLGIDLIPATWWVVPSFFLCMSLGFAMDLLFACLMIYMMNARWLVIQLRDSISWFLSGDVIPLVILPFGLGGVLKYNPFASMGGAFLSVYTGTGDPVSIVMLQAIWNIAGWTAAYCLFKKSQERLVCNGG